MSLRLLYKLAAVVAVLVLAATAAESAPRTTSAIAKSAMALPLVPPSQAPHRPPRPATAIPPAPVQSSAPALPVARPAPPPAPRVAVASGQWGLINQDRAAAGLPPLRWSGCLATVALQNATRMAAQGFISHTNGPSLDLGCHLGFRAGENVGYISNGVNDPQMNAMFMASPEHRANILGPYHYVGVSWVVAPNGFAYIAVEFG